VAPRHRGHSIRYDRTVPDTPSGLLAGLDWLDSLSLTGLDGQNLNESVLKNGNLIVDDQQRGNKWNFKNITLSLRRPSGGGVALSVGEEGSHPWSLRVAVGASANGVRSVDIRADKVATTNILLALRLKDLTYSADLLLTGELKGELAGTACRPISAQDFHRRRKYHRQRYPDYPMGIDSAEMSVEWDAGRRVLVAPSRSSPARTGSHCWPILNHPTTAFRLADGFSGGTIVLPGTNGEAPLIFNRIAVGMRFDTEKHRVLLTQADISNGEIGIAEPEASIIRRAAPDARFRGNADVGIGAEADVADSHRSGGREWVIERSTAARFSASRLGSIRRFTTCPAEVPRSRMTGLPSTSSPAALPCGRG